MPRSVTAVLSLGKLSIPDKIKQGDYINQQYGLYSDLFPDTFRYKKTDMVKVVEALRFAHGATAGGGTLVTAQERAAAARFDEVMGAYRDWANGTDIAYNDAVKIAQLGLDVSRPPTPTGDMPKLVLLPLMGTNKGELDLTVEKFGKFASINIFVAYGDEVPADADYTYCCGSTKLRTTLKLTSKRNAWVKALAVGPNGDGPLSDAVERGVL